MEAPTRAFKGLRAVRDPKHAWKLHAREPGGPSNARHDFVSGPVGEGHEPEVQHARCWGVGRSNSTDEVPRWRRAWREGDRPKRTSSRRPRPRLRVGLTRRAACSVCEKQLNGKGRRGGFSVDRKTIRKRLSAKLKAIREELRRRWHETVAEVGKWLRSVVQGYFNYHAVPANIDSLQSFRAQVVWHWSRALQRRSQKSRMPWERFGPLVARWIPSAVILHPRPAMRFNARYLR
jgi:hypothetical protein